MGAFNFLSSGAGQLVAEIFLKVGRFNWIFFENTLNVAFHLALHRSALRSHRVFTR